jgi:hypothetical protein
MASNLWVAVGNGGTGNSIVTSSDGNTWTSTGTTVIGPSAVAYKSNLWVAVGGGGNAVATSTDGITWTGRGSTMFSGGEGTCVAWGNNLWVAGGYYSIATSPNGITWTNRSSLMAYANGIAYGKDGSGNGLWVATGYHPSNPNSIATSTDGITWTVRGGFGYQYAYGVAYGNRLWVAVGSGMNGNAIMSSINGINWIGRGSAGFSVANGVAYGQDGSGNKLWVAVGTGGNTIATSPDGITWTGRGKTVFTSEGKSVTYANGLWVATGTGGRTIATSTDGINWTGKNNPLTSIGRGVVGPTKSSLLTNYYLPTKTIADASFNIIPPTSNNYGAFTYTSSNTAVATIIGSKINIVGVGTSTITAVQEETFSYLSGTNTATFQVIQSTEGTETVLSDFSVPTKIIGDASFNIVVPTTNSDGAFIYTSSNIAVATIVGSTVTIVGVGTSTISAIQLMTSTYASATITAPFVVNQITTVLSNFSVPTKTFGDVSFGIVAPTSNGNGSFSYASSDTTVVTISGDRITVIGGGSSTITATQASTTNYTSATITAPITVNQATTVLANFSIEPKTITDASFTIPSITTNSTGLFSYTSSDPTVATISGNVATIVGIGSATITADQASNANYLAQTISTTVSVSRNLWVAVGQGTVNTVASSYDGIVWKGLGVPTVLSSPQSIAYSNNLWVAVGYGTNTLAFSTTNGNNWTGFGKTVFSTAGYQILYDPSAALWIATGDGGNSIATSTNPKTTWIGQGTIFPSSAPVNCLYGSAIYSETQNFSAYLLGGYSTGSLLAYSLDGTTWQMGTETSTSLACQGFNTIVYGNGVYVAGCTPTGSGNSFATSTDKTSWTGRGGSSLMSNVSQIAYGNGMFIAAGIRGTSGSSILKSTDGVTWTNLPNVFNTSYGAPCVAYYQGRWFVGSDSYYGIMYSNDNGITWNYAPTSYTIYSIKSKSIACGYGVVISVGQGTGNTLAISIDFGVSWNGRGLLLTGSGNDVKYNNGVWLAVGGDNVSTGNVIVKSTDNGTTWTQVAIYNTSYFTSVNGVQNVNDIWYITGRGASYLAYSNTNNPSSMSDFVMVSTSSVYFSTNGVCLSTFNYQKPRYIVGGKGMKGSVDGFSWFDILNQPFTTVNDVYWNGTIWVGVGVCLMPGSSSSVRNTIAYSYDGINWIGLGVTIFTTSGNNVYYSTANSLWIATGAGTNTMATSVDGITWTGRGTTVFTTAGGKITYDNNLLVAVGEGLNKFATSTNGISWDVNASLSTGRGVAYNNGTWFIVGDGNLATSTDGIIWRDFTVTGFLSNKSIAYGNGIWVVGGRDNYNNAGIVRSTNGTTWTSSTSTGGINDEVCKVANGKDGSGNNLWVAVGRGAIASSPDAISWTGRGVGIFNTYSFSVACGKDGSNNNFWVAVGQHTVSGNNIATSVDGITWTGRKANAFITGIGVAYGKDGSGNGLWVAVGSGGTLYNISTSSDGITWIGRYGGFGYYEGAYSVAYGNGLWVMVGTGANTIYTSPDGITWTARTNIFTAGIGTGHDVTYANGLWVATGYNNTGFAVATSTNGISWTLRNQVVFNSKGYDVVGPTSQVTKITTVLNNFSVPAKTVGDVSFSLVAPTSNSDGVITYTSSNLAVASIVDNVVTIVGGGTTTIRATQASTADYTIGVISTTLTVTQITTVLTDFSVPTKTFGDASFGIIAPTTSRDGFFTYSSSNSAVAITTSNVITVVGAGSATITAVELATPDYAAATITAPFVVNQATPVMTNFSVPTKTFGDASFNIIPPVTNADGLITYTSSDTAVAAISGTKIIIVGGGSTTITANQAGTINFVPNSITATFQVNQAIPTITNFVVPSKVTESVPFTIVAPTTNSSGAFTYESSDISVATIDGSMVTIVGKGTSTITAVQESTTNYLSGSITATLIVRRTPVITDFSLAAKTFGDVSFSIIPPITDSDGTLTYTSSNIAVATVGGGLLYVAMGSGGNTISTSIDGISWIGRGKTVFTTAGISVAFGQDSSGAALWVAVGIGGNTIATSTDGIAWTGRGSSVITTQGRGVVYYNGLWVAAGQGGNTIATSTDGIIWTGRGSTVFTNNTMGIAYGKDGLGNNLLVAIGNGGNTIASSTDGITWTGRGATVFTSIGYGVAYGKDAAGNGLWVAVGSGGNTIATSSNGTTWTGRGSSFFSIYGWGVAFGKDGSGNNLWVAVGNDGSNINNIATSTNGTSWTGRGLIFTTTGSSVTYTDGLWVATGSGGNSVATSTNGTVWTGRGQTVFTTYGYGVTKGGVPLALDTVTIVGAGTTTITATQSLTANYVSGTIAAPLVINQATTVLSDFSVPTKIFGDGAFGIIAPTTNSNGVFTYTSSDTSVATIAGSTVTIVGGGTTTITANQASANNYLSSSITATFQVNPATPIIAKFDIPVKTLENAPFIIAPPTTNSNGIFSYTSSNAEVATIDGSMVTINGLGTTTITAVQSSTTNFISATTSGILAVMDKVPLSIAVGQGGNTIATSTDLGLTWTGQGATTFTTSGYGVAGPATYDVSSVSISLYTIIDSSGIISTSEDGNTWTARSSTGFNGKCVAYSNNTWLAGGIGGLSYSLDGVNWTKTSLTLPVHGLSYANNIWVAVGGGGYSTSSDGITWGTVGSMGVAINQTNDVAYGNNRWISVGGGTSTNPLIMLSSTNGTSWGTYGLGAFSVGRGVAYGNGRWVAVGDVGTDTMIIGGTANDWTRLGNHLFTISGRGVAFGKDGSGAGFWVAVGEGNNTIATSPDGITWTGRGSTIFTTRGTKVRYYNNLWFAFGEGGNTFASSTNGINWVGSNKTRGSDIFYLSSTYTKPTYIAVGQGLTTMAGSTNGMTWTPPYNKPFVTTGYSVAWNGVQWVATGQGRNTIATSTDGVIWTGNSVFSTLGFYVAYGKDSSGNGLWVATGYGGNSFATSSDGVVWTGRTGLTVFTSGGCGIAFGKDGSGNALWVAVGQGGNTIATSTNGTTWVGRGATVFTTQGYRVTYANNLWIAVGSGGNSIATSTNGTTWTGFGTTVFTTQGNGIRYTNNLWVATGEGGGNTIATSVDGTKWVGRGSTVFTTAGRDVLGLITAEPTLIFTIPLRNIGDAPFTIVPPTSNSTGLITYTSSNAEVATIDGSTVTIVGMGTSTITAVQESTDYFISGTITATLTVENVKPVVTDFSVPEKTFGDDAFSIVAPTSNSDGIFTYTSSNTAVATVSGSTITIVSAGTSTITASQAITADYGSAKITSTLTVNKATPTITNFSEITKTFGNAAFSLVAPTSNSTGAFTYTSSNTAVATIAGSTVTIVGGGTATITASQATTANYLAGTTTATMTVNQATPTITNFSVPAKVAENAPFTIVNPTSNSSGAFTYTSSDTSVATMDGSMVTIVGKGTSTITATQASTTNYLSGSIIATFIVRLTPVITNFSAITKTFGDASFSIVAPTTDSDGAFTYTSSNTAVATVSGTTITIVSTGTSTITASQSLTANYVSGTITTTLTVNKATTVLSNFSEITKTFGNAAFSLVAPTSNRTGAFTYTSSNTAVATVSGTTVTIVGGGTATITATQATTTNYLAGTTTATLTVNKTTPTITNFSAITKTFGNAAFNLVAPTSNSAGSFTYTSSNTAVATIAGSTVTIVGGGTATITASQATTTNYLDGTITATMTVSQATPSITIFDVPAKAIGTAPFTLVNPTSNSSGAFTYTSSNTSVATIDGSMVTIVGLGNTTITAVQASTTNYLSGSITGILTIMVNVPLSIAVGSGGNSIATSIDRGLTWNGRGTTVFTTSGSCVAFGKDGSGNNILVAVGQGGNTIATSTNGTTWIGRGASVFTTQGIGVTYANNLWVAVGQGTNSIATSPDGIVWTGRGQTIFSGSGWGVAFNNGLWVAVGAGTNSIATSPDGITWTGRGTIFSSGYGVAFGNGLWVAVGEGTNSIATSTNGTVWTGRTGKTALSGWGRGVAYGNGLWVAVGQGTNSIATSTDGITWTGRTGTSIFSNNGFGVAFNSGLWIAVGQGTNTVAMSMDGTVWTGRGTSTFSTSGAGVAVGIITPPNITGISPSSGAIVGGTSVTITGTNFTGATSVTFDGIAVTSLNIVNSTTITCITPARSAGAVGIIVTTEDGPSGEFSSFTYITPPSITGISPLSGSTEGGTNVTITGTSFTGVTSVTFDGLAATTINVVNNTTMTCITPARSVGDVGIIVTTLYGTSSIFSPFTYITPPNITSISSSFGSTLGGTSVTITGINFTGATSVTFGGFAATTINVVNSTTITCITPARTTAGAVGIIVTTGGGPSSAFSSFTYITPPNITEISPSSGSTLGGTTVTITGTNFTGATSVTFGGLAATTINVVNSTTITCITRDRTAGAGAVGIIVTTGGGPSDAFSSFNYITPPVITSILPLTGSTTGGTSVTITGTSFTGATLVTFGGLSATSLSVVNSTTITCITPTRSTGAVGIIVTSLYGKSGAFSSFTYISPPVISRISPSSGGITGGTSVTITGRNFTGATLVTFDGIAATSLSIVNSTTITCITPAVDSAGAAGIIVTTGGGPSGAFSSFTYIPTPNISSISQLTGSTAGGTNVTITGTNFTGATSVTFDGLAATTINVVNSTTITCITPARSVGVADIIVTTGGGPSGAFSSFTYITPPVISSISQLTGSTLGGTSVIITGTNFTGATSVTFGGIAATSLTIVDSTTISCITPVRTTAGDVGIIVTTGGGPSGEFSSFTYITPPNITGISPLTGSIAGGTSITITGTNFTGATSVTFDGISATSLTIVNSNTITCSTPARATAGAVDIIVTTEGGPSSAFSSFTYITPPVISSISQLTGSTLGGTSVTITGTNFTGATSVTFDGLAATTINVVDSTTITCITPARTTAGAVGIIVTTGGGPSGEFSSFTYITPASITEISPSSGINTGGTSVTITGTNFTGATSVTFGGVAATSLTIVNNTTITCITPAVDSDGAVGIIVTTEVGPSSAFSSFTYITNPNITGISPSSGSIVGETNVTITGINFTGATSVTFDGLAATNIDVVNSTTITCITPAHNAGAVGIIVTAEGGPSDEFSSFTYITPPNITGILSSSGSTLGGTNVTITGTNFTGATSVTFDGLAATTIHVVDNTTITCITPARATAGDVGIIVTTAGGPSDEFSSFTYITPPNITGITPSSGSILGGTSVTITGTSFTEATSVTFDGLAATSLTIVNNTTITCSTPARSAGDVGIIVTTIYGTSNTFSPFTYITPPNITSISQLTGSTAGGTSVTITGTNFSGATSVTFDGLAATTINVVNSTTITCITPAHTAGAVDIIITTDGGPSGEFSSFTYITPPNITGISPLTGSIAGGTSVTITGTNFTGTTSVTFGGISATSLSLVNSTTITCITPARTTAGAVGIIVTTGGGPSGEFSSFTYITPPNITGILPSSGSILGGTSVTITGTNFTGATLVTFGGLSATSLSVVNSNTITCITPARSVGAVGIIVTTGGGPSNTFSSFTYIAPPNITGITPLFGSTTGGTSVTITGTSFTGATSVTFGGIAATSLTLVDSTTITCITPARATAGAVGVIVITGGGPSNTFASFTYILPPNIKSMTPASVSRVGGTIVTITGTNFIGATSVTLGGLNATSFNVVNGTSITCVTPERTTGGMVSVIVTTGGGPSNTFSTFIYVPFVSAILPAFGTRTGGTSVKITGIGFKGATSVTFGGIPATNLFVFNPTTITCRTPAGIVAEAVGVIVSTGDGPSNTFSSFTYITPPNITGISPSYGGTVGGTIVTITGKSFTGVSSVLFGGLKVKSLKVIDDTTITCVTAARATPVPVGITVQNSIGISNVFSSYTYIMTPKLTSISPNFGSTTGGNTVTITGTDFIGATEVTVGDLSCSTFTVIDNNTLTCITPARIAPGPVGIIVTTGGGQTKKSSPFTYILPPVITSISPPFGGTTGGNVVTITGVNFKGVSSVLFGGLNATLVKAVNDTTITCKTPVTLTAGPVDVIVRTGGGPSNTFSSFTYIIPPVISDISPPAGSTLGGNIVTITGTNLTGATSVLFGKAAATNITVVDDTTLTCRTPLNKAGAIGVIVRTGGGPSTIFSSFTFVTPASITGILPLSGSTNGGTFVTLKGKDFTGATSLTIGGVEATSFTVVSATAITCITPARISAGGVGIIVTTAGGQSKQFSFFNYIIPPVITSLSPSTGSTAGGTIVTITGTNFTGATSVTINGKAATPIKVVDNTTITCKAPINLIAGPVDVIVTTGGGPSSAFSSYTYVTPAVITSISPTFGTKAGGTSVTITGTNLTGASNLLFGLKSATNVNVVNDTTITCITPDSVNPVAVGITLTTGGGLSKKFSSFTYR